MRKLVQGDYVIPMSEVKTMLQHKLVGALTFNEELQRVEKIISVEYVNATINLGTFFKPKYREFTIVLGVNIKSETKDSYSEGFVKFEPGKGVEWINEIIPRRIKLFEKIEKQLKFMTK